MTALNFKVLKRVAGSKLTVFGRPTRPNASFGNSSWQRLPRWIFVRRGCVRDHEAYGCRYRDLTLLHLRAPFLQMHPLPTHRLISSALLP